MRLEPVIFEPLAAPPRTVRLPVVPSLPRTIPLLAVSTVNTLLLEAFLTWKVVVLLVVFALTHSQSRNWKPRLRRKHRI